MKRSKRIIILLVVLAAVCIATFAISRYQQTQEEIKASGETILSVATEDVTKVSWTNESGEYSFTKDGETWKYDGDEAFPVSTETMEDMLSIFNEFGAAFIIENVTDYAQYGLDDPIATIHLETDEVSYDISLGDYSQIDEERYVSLGDENAYLAVNDPLDEFDAISDDLIANDIIPSFSNPDSMSIVTRDDDYTITYEEDSSYSYNDDDVYFADISGETRPLSTSNVNSYLTALRALELTNFVNYKVTDAELADYGLDDPDVTISVEFTPEDTEDQSSANSSATTTSGTASATSSGDTSSATQSFTLVIARDPEEAAEELEAASSSEATASQESDSDSSSTDSTEITAYARMNDSPIIYQIDGDAYTSLLAADFNDLRHAEVVPATTDIMTGIDITLEQMSYSLIKETSGSGDDETDTWMLDGEEVDAQDLVNAIQDAEASEFTDGGDTQREEISFTVHLTDPDFPTVNVVFYRNDGSTCLAVVDGEIFGLVPRSDVVDIIEALNSIVL